MIPGVIKALMVYAVIAFVLFMTVIIYVVLRDDVK